MRVVKVPNGLTCGDKFTFIGTIVFDTQDLLGGNVTPVDTTLDTVLVQPDGHAGQPNGLHIASVQRHTYNDHPLADNEEVRIVLLALQTDGAVAIEACQREGQKDSLEKAVYDLRTFRFVCRCLDRVGWHFNVSV